MPGYIPFQGLTGNRVAALDKHFRTMPNQYQGLVSSGLFKSRQIAVSTVLVEERNGVLYIVKSNTKDAPDQKNHSGERNLYEFRTNSHKVNDAVYPEDIEGQGAFSTEKELIQTENEEIAERLENISMSHDLTEEYHISQVLQGRLLNTDGSVLFDVYDKFGLTRSDYELDFALTNSATKINEKFNELLVKMRKNALGEIYREIHVRCNATFINNLLGNENVNNIMKGNDLAPNLLRDYHDGNGFSLPEFPKIKFFLYDAEGDNGEGENIQFLPDLPGEKGRAFAYPVGTRDAFRLYRSPALRFGQINRKVKGNGRWVYMEAMKDGSRVDIQTENNFIPVPMRPRMLFQLTG